MKASEVFKALENGKRISNTEWEEGNYWEMRNGTIISVGNGKVGRPQYNINDLYEYGKWIVVPKYIPFSEAMKAVEEGKDVFCHFNNELIKILSYNNKINSICKGKSCTTGGGASIPIAWIVAGKWEVEEVNE